MLYIQTAQLGDFNHRVSTSGDADDLGHLGLEEILDATKASFQAVSTLVVPELPDWCADVRELWGDPQTDPCTELAKDLARLREEVTTWEGPQNFLRTFSRWQFSVAPNITRIELLTDILEQTENCIIGKADVSQNFTESADLQAVAADDRASLEEQYHILHRAARILHRAGDIVQHDKLGLLGLVRGVLEAQHTIHLSFDEASTWAFRIKTRGNGLQLRLQGVAERLNSLHEILKSLPNYRSLAFREIHSAGHWGRLSSGSGSSQRATSSIGATFLHFLQGMQLASDPTDPSKQLSILDVGCGWGEWLPSMLLKAVEERSLREDFVYFGLDIAEQPIDSLRTRFGHSFQFAVLDACRDPLPVDFSVALVRHVFQHLNLADALSLLRNVYRAKPQLVVLSSWPEATNQDLPGGSSAFEALSPGHEIFKGYDLRKPPFNLPEPLKVWKEMAGEELLLYPSTILQGLERDDA